jgi:hypothetical protein
MHTDICTSNELPIHHRDYLDSEAAVGTEQPAFGELRLHKILNEELNILE